MIFDDGVSDQLSHFPDVFVFVFFTDVICVLAFRKIYHVNYLNGETYL